MPMIRHGMRLISEIIGIAAGGILVVAALVAWRLSQAPIEAKFIRPYLEQAINDAGLGITVDLGEAKLGWHRFQPALDLHVRDVKVMGQGGATIAAFQDATVGLSIESLIFGHVALTKLDLIRPQIAIIRDASDHFSMRVGAAAPDAAVSATTDPTAEPDPIALLRGLAAPPGEGNALSRLRRVHIVSGVVVVDDQKRGVAWSAPNVDIDLARDAKQTAARVDLLLALPKSTAHFVGTVELARARGQTVASLKVSDFDASAVAPLAKPLEPLAALAMPVSGDLNATLDESGRLLQANVALQGNDGRVVLPDFYPDPLAVKSLALKAHFTNGPQILTVDQMAVDLGDARALVTGTANIDGPSAAFDLHADLANIPLQRFDTLWPHGVAIGGRDWVTTHIPGGTVKSGTVRVQGTAKTDQSDMLQDVTLSGAFDYEGLDVDYFPPLPHVKNIAGHATFDQKGMDLTIDSGALGDIAVSDGLLRLSGFDQDDRAIDIGLSIDGPLMTALTVLDSPPLQFIRKLDLDPKNTAGQAKQRLTFSFPLVKSLLTKDIVYSAKGTLAGVSIMNAVGPRDVTDGTLDIAIDPKGMKLTGDAKLASVPLSLDWTESFVDTDKVRTQIAFKGDVDDSGWKALKLDPSDLLTLHGKVGILGKVSIDRAHVTTIDVTGDLSAAALSSGTLGLEKAAGETGTAAVTALFTDGKLRQVQKLAIDAQNAKLAGTAQFGPDGALRHAEFPKVAGKGSDYSLVVDPVLGAKPAYAIAVKGARFNAQPLLSETGGKSDDQPNNSPRLDLTLDLGRVLSSPDRGIDAVTGTLSMTGGRLDRAAVQAKAGGKLTLDYQPSGTNAIALHLAAEDAGATLSGLGITSGVRGGTLKLDGETTGGDAQRMTRGTLDMRDFRLINAPIIARLVNAVSPTGFVDLLSGQGLGFDRLDSEVDYSSGKITFRNGRSAGALGISFEGNVDFDKNGIALKGTVVPVDTLNRIIAAIPVIGNIVTGGSRGGFLGWTYTVSGTPNDPKVSVNPLSVFAPGFLRNLFFLGPSEPKPEAAKE